MILLRGARIIWILIVSTAKNGHDLREHLALWVLLGPRLGAVLRRHRPTARLLVVVSAPRARVQATQGAAIRVMISEIIIILCLLGRPLVDRRPVAPETAADLSIELLVLLDLALCLQGRGVKVRLDVLLAVAPGLEDLGLALLRLATIEGIQLAQVLGVAPWHPDHLILVQLLALLTGERLLLRGEEV